MLQVLRAVTIKMGASTFLQRREGLSKSLAHREMDCNGRALYMAILFTEPHLDFFFFCWGYIKVAVYLSPLDIIFTKHPERIRAVGASYTSDLLSKV
jgi:hypothetical protein